MTDATDAQLQERQDLAHLIRTDPEWAMGRILHLEQQRTELIAALNRAFSAVNASYEQCDAEWREHDRKAELFGNMVDGWREHARSTLDSARAAP